MERIVFCNTGWMSWYKGLTKQPDKIVGGGSYVRKNGFGGEVCNFLSCDNSNVYGHVESIKGTKDRQICIEKFGGLPEDVSLSGITLVWMATHPTEGGRRVVGWYRNATIFRFRQQFDDFPSGQHKKDEIGSFRVRALAKDSCLLNVDERNLRMPKGKGWMGQTSWWSPENSSSKEVSEFIQSVRLLIGNKSNDTRVSQTNGRKERGMKSPDTAKNPYSRYVQEHEVTITPKHNKLQKRFEKFLKQSGATEIQANRDSVDVQYRDVRDGRILAEIKPCEKASARFAIRTAIGQLSDYQQRAERKPLLLIVIEVCPTKEDRLLATTNGFGIAYPQKSGFTFVWPDSTL
ncbi:hypothetical protein [Phaeobacter inhibens]|uniref:hypothetical protein n=1 Tax=Phaeobacter inhibens TaxID=221822 RepID=UPI000CA24DEC|nr:hypothetical protein [Phaeobacter inhibens]AUQ68361.1 hypothetical protein PhaeoP78_03544 [Phaeobacter inhibens]